MTDPDQNTPRPDEDDAGSPARNPADQGSAEHAGQQTPEAPETPQSPAAPQAQQTSTAEDEPSAGQASQGEEQPTPQLTRSQVKRLSQPMIGMLITMMVTVAVVVALLMLNPEPDTEPYQRDEDVHVEAVHAGRSAEFLPAAPDVPDEWSANYAYWENQSEQGIPLWEVGFTTDSMTFVGFSQSDQGNPTWISEETEGATPSGTQTVDGVVFEVYHGDEDRTWFVLTEEHNDVDGTTVVLGGDASEEDLEIALTATVEALDQEPDVPADDAAEVEDPSSGQDEGQNDTAQEEETEDD